MEVRFCELHEIEQLQKFIRCEWSADHIFVYSKVLLDYQHLNVAQERYNFVVASDSTGQFQAVLGFIPPEHFRADDDTIWLSLWKTAKDCKQKSIGLLLLRFLESSYPGRSISTAGISEQARLIYKALQFEVRQLSQYYLTVSESPGRIAVGLIPFGGGFSQKQLPLLDGAISHSKSQSSARYRKRGLEYFERKYLRHPIYAYSGVHSETNDLTIIYRVVEIPEGKVVRIVDCGGNLQTFPAIVAALIERAKEIGADYMDMLAYWADDQPILQAGFKAVSDEVVPNYFEPFLQKNVLIECAVKGRVMSDLVVMKGDGDQDRPSRIKGINA